MITTTVKLKSATPLSQSRPITSERKSNETFEAFENRTWKEHLHVDSKGYVILPPMMLKNCLDNAAQLLGMKVPEMGARTYKGIFGAAVMVLDPVRLDVHQDEVEGERLFVPSDGVRGGGKRVKKTFPFIPEWEGEAVFFISDGLITEEVFRKHLEAAGKFVGVGRFRPNSFGYYGRFTVESLKWDDPEGISQSPKPEKAVKA